MSDAVALPPSPPDETVLEEPPVPTRRLLVFELAGHVFACDMEAFREIIPTRAMTRLPGAPETVCGLINLRGTIVTVIDGGVSLGKSAFKRTEGLILLVDVAERWVGVGVDDVRDISDVPIDRFASAGETEIPLAGAVTGVVELDGRSVLVLDIKTVVQQVIAQGR